MKYNKKSLYYFIILVIITSIAGLFSCQEVTAEDINEVSDRICNFKVGTNFWGNKGIECKDIKSTKTYRITWGYIDEESDSQEKKAVVKDGYCYFDPKNYGFFYEVVTKTGTMKTNIGGSTFEIDADGRRVGSAFINIGTSELTQEVGKIYVHTNNGKLASTDGCAPYVYMSTSPERYLFSYEYLDTDSAEKELGVDKVYIGTTEIDNQLIQKVESCIENELLNGKHCSEENFVDNIFSSCMVSSGVMLGNDSANELNTTLLNKYSSSGSEGKRFAVLFSETCELVTNCHAEPTDINNFLNQYEKGLDPSSIEKILKNSFSSKKIQDCVNEQLKLGLDRNSGKVLETLGGELPTAVESGTNDIIGGRTSILGENGQTYTYVGEKLTGNPVLIDPGNNCEAILSDEATKLFNTVLRYMQYLGPVLVVVLSTIDFIKAAASGNPDDMKKAWNKLVKRLIAAILLFFVSLITRLLLSFFDITVPENCIK